MAQQVVQLKSQDPEYIIYLFSPEVDHDCYFNVGNRSLMQPVRIGVVKKMLLAHSVVFRTELQESKIREKGDVPLEDLYPDTFKHLLRYVYGHDNTATLTFDEADNLLYAAEKYMMAVYKNKLATRLMRLLNADNICSLLNNPACFRVLELDNAITKILQNETDQVLASPPFFNLSPDALVKILEQGTMNVAEIEVWRAALKWAKEKTGSEDSQVQRKQLTAPLKQIRLCTLDPKDFCIEVATTEILSAHETKLVSLSIKDKVKQESLTDVSNEIETRKAPCNKSAQSCKELVFNNHSEIDSFINSCLIIDTKSCGIDLLPLQFQANSPTSESDLTYLCECTVIITGLQFNVTNETLALVSYKDHVEFGKPFKIPITNNGQAVKLLPHSRYKLQITFSKSHKVYYCDRDMCSTYEDEHVVVGFEVGLCFSWSHFKSLLYRLT